ncbi:MAG: Hpt domain-containing protein [Bacteroidales bacterium]|nr:Hpt domain-containing protein [Bacteroidales bacterium]
MKTDLSYLQEMSGGNLELVKEMISIFKSQVIEFTKDMENHLNNKEFELLGKLAHKAKSSVSIMGLNDLANDLKTLENLAKEGKNAERYPALVRRFREITEEAVEELNIVQNNIEHYF